MQSANNNDENEPIAVAERATRTLNIRSATLRAHLQELRARGVHVPLLRRIRLRWNSAWFSLACILQERQHSDATPSADPVVICGFWRSGTTLLHEVLAHDERFSYPRTDLCMNPALITSGLRSAASGVRRPMDAMIVRPDSPQEDEFALLALGSPSFYETMLLPRSWSKKMATLDMDRWSNEEVAAWLHRFQFFLGLLAKSDRRPVLLKSPTHGFRIAFLARHFPETTFIFLLRDPLDNYVSNLKLWNAMFDLYALESFDRDEIPEMTCQLFELATARALADLKHVGPDRLTAVSYERFVEDPLATLRRIYASFRRPWTDQLEAIFQQQVTAIRPHVPDRLIAPEFSSALFDRVSKAHAQLQEALIPYGL